MMNFIRPKLCKIVTRHGTSICNDPVRCEGLLTDYCGEYKRELFVLTNALKEGIPSDLLSFRGTTLLDLRISQLTERLHFNMSFERDAARWGIESWALALGVMDISDLRSQMSQNRIIPHWDLNKGAKNDLHNTTKEKASSGGNAANTGGRSNLRKGEVWKRNVWVMLSIFYLGFVLGWILSRMC